MEIPDYLKLNSLATRSPGQAITAREIVPPIFDFAKNALALGHINVVADSDGTVRTEPLLVSYESFAQLGWLLFLCR